VTPEAFEALIREALGERDKLRKSRLMDPNVMAAADAAFVAAVMKAAGFTEPESTQKTGARARRAAKQNADVAFRDAPARAPRR
jgi:hypothetical protein